MRDRSGPGEERRRRRTLHDPRLDAELDTAGVATAPLLGPLAIAQFAAAHLELTPAGETGMAIDYTRDDRELVRRISDTLTALLAPHIDELLVDHQPVLTTFVVKHPGDGSDMYLHDDRSYVDERTDRAVTLWIPLEDVGPKLPNGGLQVVRGSHRLPTGLSGSRTPDLIRPYERALRGRLEPLTMRAGDVAVYDTRLLHASDANRGARPRVAIACALAPRTAQLVHVVATGRRGRRIHAVDAGFYVRHHPADVTRTMPSGYPVIDEREEDPVLRPQDVARALDVDRWPDPEIVLADDMVTEEWDGMMDRLRPFPTRRGKAPVANHDLTIRDALEPDSIPPEFTIQVMASEGIGARTLRRGHEEADTLLIVGDPGSRCVVRILPAAPGSTGRGTLDVVECPAVGAGIMSDVEASTLELGATLELPRGEDLTLWNDGPGVLVVSVSAPTPSAS